MKIADNNRRAFHDYFIEDKFEAGMELLGWEVKSARNGGVNLSDSFVYFEVTKSLRGAKGDEAIPSRTNSNARIPQIECWLKNSHFAPYRDGRQEEQNTKRDRKLLLKRAQIEKLHNSVRAKGYTCVATKIYFNSRGLVKVEIARARGKHTYDKKQSLKERDIKRETEKSVFTKRGQ